jgi:hypothetical protein
MNEWHPRYPHTEDVRFLTQHDTPLQRQGTYGGTNSAHGRDALAFWFSFYDLIWFDFCFGLVWFDGLGLSLSWDLGGKALCR